MGALIKWNSFRFTFDGNEQEAFEKLAYALFCRKYGLSEGTLRMFNQWYIETTPVKIGDDYVGFQAKYYLSPTVNDEQERALASTIRNAHEKYPELTILQIYLANEFSDSKDSSISRRQGKIEKVAEECGITIEWVLPSNLEILLNREDTKDIKEFFFPEIYNFSAKDKCKDLLPLNQKKEEKTGMLFLFDVIDSTKTASKEEHLRNSIVFQKISMITGRIVEEINDKQKKETIVIQNTGDGSYLFSEEFEIALHLWILLVQQFSLEGIQIRCGAGYGRVLINGENTGSHLGNIVARCCQFCSSAGELVITDILYGLLKDSSYFRAILPKVNPIDRPNLKGCEDILRVYRLTRTNNRQALAKINKSNPEIEFYGREDILRECTQLASICFSRNQALTITGVSGVGKTTLAMSVATQIGLRPICVDLRQIASLRDLHRAIVDVCFKDLSNYNLSNEALYNGESTLVNILSRIPSLGFVFDHAELLAENTERYAELLEFFQKLHDLHVYLIMTSTCKLLFESLNMQTWTLRNPNDNEKVCMLSHWIKTKRPWLESLATHIANHSYLICLVGQQFQGSYRLKKEIVDIEYQIEGADNVSEYIIRVLKQLPDETRFWVYLAYLCNGSIYTKAIPKTSLDAYNERGLIKQIGGTTIFHPLVMRAIDSERGVLDFRKESHKMLCGIGDEKCATLIEYYKYLCYEQSDGENKKRALISNWQTWSEEIDSYKVQALIEQLTKDVGKDREAIVFDLFSSIIYIFQGKHNDLEIALRKLNGLAEEVTAPMCVRLLAKMESIECQRKLKGPACAISLINDNLDFFNDGISMVCDDSYAYYGKYYYIGTFFFLIGNILRSLEDHENAIAAYRVSLSFIKKETSLFRNAELQKVHISYGIAESYLKNGQYHFAIEIANETIRTTQAMAKFGRGLFFLLKARAYLCDDFSDKKNYEEALKSVKIAAELFSDIRLPNYIQRCDFVEAAIYVKKKKISSARKKLVEINEHLPGNNVMSYCVEILLDRILRIKGEITKEKIHAIIQRKGMQIGLFYKMQSGIEYEMPFDRPIPTIKLAENRLEKDSFSIKEYDLSKNLWLVD